MEKLKVVFMIIVIIHKVYIDKKKKNARNSNNRIYEQKSYILQNNTQSAIFAHRNKSEHIYYFKNLYSN